MFCEDLRYFIAVAECLNFTVAAEKLYISQSGLSKHISKMEDCLGVKLFLRKKPRIELTSAGEKMLTLAKRFLLDCHIAITEEQPKQSAICGDITIGYVDIFARPMISKIIDFRNAEFKNVNLHLSKLSNLDSSEQFNNNRIDIGITLSNAVNNNPFLEWKVIESADMKVIVSATHPLANRRKISIHELSGETFLTVIPEAGNLSDEIVKLYRSCGFIPKELQYVSDFATLYLLVEAGKGIAIVSSVTEIYCNDNIRSIDLNVEESKFDTLRQDLVIAWKKNNPNPIVPYFVDMLNIKMLNETMTS